MNFDKRVKEIGDILKEQDDDIVIINNIHFSYSNAFIYICSSLKEILGKNTNSNIIIGDISIHNANPMVKSITQNNKTVSHHSVFLSKICEKNVHHWFSQLAHEMVHVFLSIKDNRIESSKDNASVFEEGLAIYLSSYLYKIYFTEIKINNSLIVINDKNYIYAENLFKKVLLLNNEDINFIKKVRIHNPSLKKIKKSDFRDINITSDLIQKISVNFNHLMEL